MGISNFVKNLMAGAKKERGFECNTDSQSIYFLASDTEIKQCRNNEAGDIISWQYTCLQMLVEQGLAIKLQHGFEVACDHAVNLDEDTRHILRLPPPYTGAFKAKISGLSENADFQLSLSLIMPNGEEVSHYHLHGPILSLSGTEEYLPDATQWSLLKAVRGHSALPETGRLRFDNLQAIERCQRAKSGGAEVDLAAFNQLRAHTPHSVKLTVEEQTSGDLLLAPDLGTDDSPESVINRLGQVDLEGSNPQCLNIGDDIILLDKDRLEAVKEVMSTRRIPSSKAKDFFKAPTAFLDASLVDLDLGFSLRVKGTTEFRPAYFGDTDESGISWVETSATSLIEPDSLSRVIKDWNDYDEFEAEFQEAGREEKSICYFKDYEILVEDRTAIREELTKIAARLSTHKKSAGNGESLPKAILDIETNDEETTYGSGESADISHYDSDLNLGNLLLSPFPYQETGIRWILGHAFEDAVDKGALLADDMGLGKTFMSLVALEQYYLTMDQRKDIRRPALIVCPLSLMENWEDEVEKVFKSSPFRGIVKLQASSDLGKFKAKGAKAETKMNAEIIGKEESLGDIRYALYTGKEAGTNRLDMPGRLVITTYETLRDYMFSLSRIDWSFVIFDEAQKIKSPNALATRAAKALRAQFKLLVSGTPVENSLKDFWCLFDVARPGFLSAYQQFRQTYMQPIREAEKTGDQAKVQLEIGRKLRNHIGNLMLRRIKEDELDGLPAKRIFTGIKHPKSGENHDPSLGGYMKDSQLRKFNSVVSIAQTEKNNGNRGAMLTALHGMKITSLHPQLDQALPEKPFSNISVSDWLNMSTKTRSLVDTLNSIKSRREKTIIFLIDKRLQFLLKIALEKKYGLNIHVINGDAPAVAKKNTLSRKGLIADFEAVDGFNVILMSPVAAGVGLTVVGANNVIHLERHWNPAKEAQATDRAYRIGQVRDVNIYVPIARHPDRLSFDENLDSLLSKKIDLKDAVVTNGDVGEEALFNNVTI